MQTTIIRASITAYSTAVGPSSAARNLLSARYILASSNGDDNSITRLLDQILQPSRRNPLPMNQGHEPLRLQAHEKQNTPYRIVPKMRSVFSRVGIVDHVERMPVGTDLPYRRV